MKNQINQRFNQIMTKMIKYHKIKSLVIALSGGQDSICLMKLLEKLKKKHYIKTYNTFI